MKILPSNHISYPSNPGVYRMLDIYGNIMYIGKAKNLKQRLKSYFDTSEKSARIKLMIKEIDSIDITVTETENDALILEQKLINKIKPKYNIIFRDDKSYPFISLSHHMFPKIYISREKNTKKNRENLFGPYSKKEDAYHNVEFIQNLFKLRTCNDSEFSNRSRPCILHSIGKCSAPCVNKNDEEYIKNYKNNVIQAKKILKGKINPTIESLNEKMQEHSRLFQYEEAAETRDIIKSLTDLSQQQTVFSLNEENLFVFNILQNENTYIGYTRILDGVPQKILYVEIEGDMKDYSSEELLTTYIESEVNKEDILPIISPIELSNLFHPYYFNSLSTQYKNWLAFVKENLKIISQEKNRVTTYDDSVYFTLKDIFIPSISSLDCIDISHFNGEATYGGKIRWSISPNHSGIFDKKKYRLSKFSHHIIDDISHIKQTVDRIYHNDNDFPSILIIDGDKPQMEAAYTAIENKNLQKNYILMCSSKGKSRKKGAEIFYIHPSCTHLINPFYLNDDVLLLDKNNCVRLLIQNLQDRAHDFSNSARKKHMSKTRFTSSKST